MVWWLLSPLRNADTFVWLCPLRWAPCKTSFADNRYGHRWYKVLDEVQSERLVLENKAWCCEQCSDSLALNHSDSESREPLCLAAESPAKVRRRPLQCQQPQQPMQSIKAQHLTQMLWQLQRCQWVNGKQPQHLTRLLWLLQQCQSLLQLLMPTKTVNPQNHEQEVVSLMSHGSSVMTTVSSVDRLDWPCLGHRWAQRQ